MTEVGVRTLKEKPSFFAPLTKAPSSIIEQIIDKYKMKLHVLLN